MIKNEFFNLLINSIQIDNFQTFYSLLCSEEAPILINSLDFNELHEINQALALRMSTYSSCSLFYTQLGFDWTIVGLEHTKDFLLNVRNVNLDEVELGLSIPQLSLKVVFFSGFSFVSLVIVWYFHILIFRSL